MNKKQTVVRTKDGYAVGYRCQYDHAGNRGLDELMRGVWQCQGCGNCVPASEVIAAQAARTAVVS